MKRKTQTQILSILISAGLILAFAMAIIASGIGDEVAESETSDGPDPAMVAVQSNPPARNISLKQSGRVVQYEYTGAAPASVSWSFGDGMGATGERVVHAYEPGRTYLVMMHAEDGNGTTTTEYALADMEKIQLAAVGIPGTDYEIQILTSTLIVCGLVSLLIFGLWIFGHKIPPRALTPRLRFAIGWCCIVAALIASGFFNGLVTNSGYGDSVPDSAPMTDYWAGAAEDFIVTNLDALIVMGILGAILYFGIDYIRKHPEAAA